MKPEPVLTLMSSLDPALIEEADLALPARRRLPKAARAGLIAACLCLALVGTAAAGVVVGWIRVSKTSFLQFEHRDGQLRSIAEVQITADGNTYIPLENFSQQSRDYADSFLSLPRYKGFDSWDEAEEFLGLHIADNAVLDEAQPFTQPDLDYTTMSDFGLPGHTDYSRHDRGWTTEQSHLVGFFGRTDSPSYIEVTGNYQIGKTGSNDSFQLSVRANMFTQPRDSDEHHYNVGFRGTDEPVTEHYVTPSGLQTVIITARSPDDSSMACYASFQLNGAYFYLSTFYFCDDPDQLVSTIKEILDAYS